MKGVHAPLQGDILERLVPKKDHPEFIF